MAVTTPAVDDIVEEDHDANRWKTYVAVAIFLAVLTVIETMTYFTPDLFGGEGSTIAIATLLVLMAIKFWTVAWFFMHLKYDKRVLTVILYAGIVLAVLVYAAILLAFRFFGPPESHEIQP